MYCGRILYRTYEELNGNPAYGVRVLVHQLFYRPVSYLRGIEIRRPVPQPRRDCFRAMYCIYEELKVSRDGLFDLVIQIILLYRTYEELKKPPYQPGTG